MSAVPVDLQIALREPVAPRRRPVVVDRVSVPSVAPRVPVAPTELEIIERKQAMSRSLRLIRRVCFVYALATLAAFVASGIVGNALLHQVRSQAQRAETQAYWAERGKRQLDIEIRSLRREDEIKNWAQENGFVASR